MTTKINLTLQADDAEPFLRESAKAAAKFGAWCDHIGSRTCGRPSWGDMSLVDAKKEWMAKFLRAKRIVESFGVDYEQTSEEKTLTVGYRYVGGKTKIVDLGPGLGKVRMNSGSQPDYKNPYPEYRRAVHEEACRQAADRVVRRWRAALPA